MSIPIGREKQVWDLLSVAIDLPPKQQVAFLDQACIENDALRVRLDSILAQPDDDLVDQIVLRALNEFGSSRKLNTVKV